MKIKYSTIVILAILLSGLTSPTVAQPIQTDQTQTDPVLTSALSLLDSIADVDYEFNIVFLGINESRIDLPTFEAELPQWHAPIDRFASYYSENGNIFRTNYTINYNFIFLDNMELSAYIAFIQSIATSGPLPQFNSIVNNPIFDSFTTADYIDSGLTEEYFMQTYNFTDIPTIFLIDTYTVDPISFSPYFYNVSEYDIDLANVPRPYGSNYQVAGGGKFSSILWMDISAGQTEYRGSSWTHASLYMDNVALTYDLAYYVQTALELRFLESYIYEPISASKNVKFEYVLVDLAQDPGYNWRDIFNPDHLVNQYSRMNPNVNWTYSYSVWNYTTDINFTNILVDARDDYNRMYNAFSILLYLDTMYQTLFNETDDSTVIIPNFLFAFPDDWMFNYLLGVAWSSGENFTYVVGAANQKWGTLGYNLNYPQMVAGYPITISPGEEFYIQSEGYLGTYPEIYQTWGTSNATLDIEILDSRNTILWNNSLPYTTVDNFTIGPGAYSQNTSISLISNYTWVIRNSGINNATFELNIDQYRDRSFGFTFVMMHEAGHAVGISHPHDGYSWKYDTDYLDWLWDLSFSQMTYAAHLSNISYIDIETFNRASFAKLYEDTINEYNNLVLILKSLNQYVPLPIQNEFVELEPLLIQTASDFYIVNEIRSLDSQANDLMNTMISLEKRIKRLITEVPLYRTSGFMDIINNDGANYSFTLTIGTNPSISNISIDELNTYFSDMSYADVYIEIYRDGELYDIVLLYTWEIDGFVLELGVPPVTSEPETNSTSTSDIPSTSTETITNPTTSTSNSTTIEVSSVDTTTEETTTPSSTSPAPLYITSVLSVLLFAPIFNRIKKKY